MPCCGDIARYHASPMALVSAHLALALRLETCTLRKPRPRPGPPTRRRADSTRLESHGGRSHRHRGQVVAIEACDGPSAHHCFSGWSARMLVRFDACGKVGRAREPILRGILSRRCGRTPFVSVPLAPIAPSNKDSPPRPFLAAFRPVFERTASAETEETRRFASPPLFSVNNTTRG